MDYSQFLTEWHSPSPTLLVHTSGSTGAPKPLLVEKHRMEASARATCQFLGLHEGDTALLCMSLDYIAGKMMAVRAVTHGLRLLVTEPSSHPLAQFAAMNQPPHIHFAAMVPMQVACLLQVPQEKELLEQIDHLIIGGGALDEALESELRTMPRAVWSSYGMTETLSHIALRRVSGDNASKWYTPMTGVTVSLNHDGCLVIDAPHLCSETLVTHDIAEMHPDDRRFRIIGRADNVINSGGIKIQIEEVERLLRPHLSAPFIITWRPDPLLGEAVVLLTQDPDIASVKATCQAILPRYWQPRHILHVTAIPLTPTAKPARQQAKLLAREEKEEIS